MSERLRFILAGFCVGFAELLPGISGSTVAIFFGIYEKLIKILSELRIKNITLNLEHLNKTFAFNLLIPFVISMIISVLAFSNLILFLQSEFANIFNIILGLIMIIGGYVLQMGLIKSNLNIWIFFFLGLIGSFLLSNLSNGTIPINNLSLAIAGFISFSFFLIPGISGSAILLVFGFYTTVIEAISLLNLTILAPFAIGALIALFIMPKLISYFIEKYRDSLIIFFSGLIVGTGIILIV